MDWLSSLILEESAGQSVFVLCLVAALGLALGRLRVAKISVGVAGVLFSGLIFGHFHIRIDHNVMDFAREAGLILFVYTIGLQLGPSFIASLRRQGLSLNLLAAFIVLAGLAVVILLHFLIGLPMAAGVGIYTGAVTNTPALGAAQEALRSFPNTPAGLAGMPGLAYAMAYPFGVVGIIASIVGIRALFGIRLDREEQEISEAEKGRRPPIRASNIVVTNRNLDGLLLKDLPGIDGADVTISRVLTGETLSVAMPDTRLHLGDTILAVGLPQALEELRLIVGELSREDLRAMPGPVSSERILVTKKDVIAKTLGELRLNQWSGVTVTRIARNGVELIPNEELALQIGDQLTVVGGDDDLARTRTLLGNSPKALQHLEIGPLFVGIALGVILGSMPVLLPGLPAPVKLGLAGGPLIVGMILSRLGKIGPLVWYMPQHANQLLRETGIVLFLACVGLKSGDRFVETLLQGPGLSWMACGAAVTIIPLFLAGIIGRLVLKLNYLTLSGTLAGSMTDPPALAFVSGTTASNGPSIAYATVYPLTMLLRVVSAQLLILVFGPG